MTILLLILKIIGIVLLAILGIVLLVVLAILLVPVRYRVMGQGETDISLKVRASWFAHLISFSGCLKEKDFSCTIRILGIKLEFRKEKSKPKLKKEKNTSRNKPKELTNNSEAHKEDETIVTPAHKEQEAKESTKKSKKLFSKIKAFPGMIRSKLEIIINKIKNFKELVIRIKNEIQDEKNKDAVKSLFDQLKILLKHISPRKVKGKIEFGMEDPATTGTILGIISLLPFLYRYEAEIYPNFETEKFFIKGKLDAKGYIRFIHILVIVIRLVKDKNVRNLINKFNQ